MIDVGVLMHEDIAEARPPPQPLGQVTRNFASLFQHRERVPVRLRGAQSRVGNPMVGDIDGRFGRQVEVSVGQIVHRRLGEESRLVQLTEGCHSCQGGGQRASSRGESISRSPMCSSLPLPGMAQPPHFAPAWLHVLMFPDRADRKAQPFVRVALAQEQAVAQNPMTQQRRGAVQQHDVQPFGRHRIGQSRRQTADRAIHATGVRAPPRRPSARRCRSRCSAAPSPGRGCRKDRQAARLASRRAAGRSKPLRPRCQSCPSRPTVEAASWTQRSILSVSPSWRRSRESRHGRRARRAR